MKKQWMLMFIVVFSTTVFSQSSLIRVPQDVPTIQAGVDSAANGDTVLVAEGTYAENVVIRKKIVLASLYVLDGDTSHISKTIIDGSNPNHPDSASTVMFDVGTDTTSVLTGFTITGGAGSRRLSAFPEFLYWQVGGGIYVAAGGARIVHNNIVGNDITGTRCAGGGITVWDPTNTGRVTIVFVESNMIADNLARGPIGYGGALALASGLPIVTNNIITRNFASAGGGAIDLEGGPVTLVNNTIVNNQGLGGPTGIRSPAGIPRMLNNIIWNPGKNVDFAGAADLAFNNVLRGGSFVGSNLTEEPSFIDTTTFSLTANSPAISAGVDSMVVRSIKLYAPATDIYGNPRPNPPGSKPDVGAVESIAQSSSPPNSQPQLFLKNLNSRGTTRSYVLFLPKNYDALASVPLVIVLHGCGGNSINAITVGMQNLADTAGFAVAYPQSRLNCWEDNVGTGFTASGDVNFISDLIDTLVYYYKVYNKRVYVCGFSSGGFLAFRLAAEMGDRLAAVAPVSGTLPNINAYNTPPASIPVAFFFGTSDPQVSYGGGTDYQSVDSTIIKWLSYNGCQPTADTVNIPDSDPTDGTTAKLIRYQSCVSGEPVYFYQIMSGGHNWPGTSHGGPAFNRDVYASAEMWNFFKDRTTSVKETAGAAPKNFALFQNYPNPFNPTTRIQFSVVSRQFTVLKIFDILGREVATLVNEELNSGSYNITLDASEFASGVYFYRLQAGEFIETKKLVLMR